MNFLFDTNILIHYIRRSEIFRHVENRYDPFGQGNLPLVSVIAVGELKSFAHQMKWGDEKWKELQQMLDKFVKIDVRYGIIDERYAAIDVFSQNKLPEKPLGLTARNMGKMICGLLRPLPYSVRNCSPPILTSTTWTGFFSTWKK